MMHEFLTMLERCALAASAALVIVLVVRVPLRHWLGAQFAYRLWLLVPVVALTAVLPAPIGAPNATLQIASAAPAFVASMPGPSTLFDMQPWLLAGWAIGALALFAGLVRQQRRYLRDLGALTAAERGVWRAQTNVGCPALVGFLRPRIVLPQDFESRYTPRERQLVLAHERMHRARFDAQINALAALLRCLNWFNPLFHFAASRLRFDQELACDALVIAKFPYARRSYADAMLKAQLIGQSWREPRLSAGCYWPSSHPLKERIAMLKLPLLSARRRVFGSATVVALALCAGYVSWAAQPARAPESSASTQSSPAAAETGHASDYVDDSPPTEKVKFRRMHPPKYPAEAVKNQISGNVTLNVHVDETGAPVSTEVVKIDPPTATILADAAIATAMQWRYTPGVKDGKPTAGDVLVPVDFRLTDDNYKPLAPSAPPTEEIGVSYRKLHPPQYPQDALANKITGKLYVKAQINADGTVGDAIVEQAYPESALALADAAVSAVKSWQFNAPTQNGAAVESEAIVPVEFGIVGYTAPPATQPAPQASTDAPVLETIKITGATQ